MKKLSLLLALIMVLSFAGCTTQELKAYDLYTKMQTAMADVKSYEAVMISDIKVQAEDGTEEMSMVMTSGIQCVIIDEDNIEVAVSIEEGGNGLSAVYYYKDGVMYFDMLGMKLKAPMAMEDMTSYAQINPELDIPALSEDYIVVSAVEEQGEDYLVTLTVKSDMMSDVVGAALSSLIGEYEGVEVDISDIEMELVIGKNDILKQQNLKYSVNLTYEGMALQAIYDMQNTYTSFNTLTEIDMPDDLDSYVEIEI